MTFKNLGVSCSLNTMVHKYGNQKLDNGSLIMANNAYFHLEYEDIITVGVLSQSMLPGNTKLLKFFIGPTHSRISSTLDLLAQPGHEERFWMGHDVANRLHNTPNHQCTCTNRTANHAEISLHSFTNSHNFILINNPKHLSSNVNVCLNFIKHKHLLTYRRRHFKFKYDISQEDILYNEQCDHMINHKNNNKNTMSFNRHSPNNIDSVVFFSENSSDVRTVRQDRFSTALRPDFIQQIVPLDHLLNITREIHVSFDFLFLTSLYTSFQECVTLDDHQMA